MRTEPLRLDLFLKLMLDQTLPFEDGRVRLQVIGVRLDHQNTGSYRLRLEDSNGKYVKWLAFADLESAHPQP